ncbi:MAG: hypothetical protein ACM3JB_16490 [Acidobacteriaceae bacterium]
MRLSRMRVAALMSLLLLGAAAPVFPQAISPVQTDKGLYQYTSFGVAHDSSAGWISEAAFTVGYDFNRHISVESGIPAYFIQDRTSDGSSTQTSRALGDWFARVIFTPVNRPFHYAMALTGTAPTGNQDLGVSAGEATWNWLNHIDKQYSRYTPFAEVGFSNSVAGDRYYQRSFTTVGNAATLRGGLAVHLLKFTSIEFSGYSVRGLGSQKMISRSVAAGGVSSPGSQMGHQPFNSQHVISGDATLANDNGFNTSLYIYPVQRVDIGVFYNRSQSYETNTVSACIGFRFGHMQKGPDHK